MSLRAAPKIGRRGRGLVSAGSLRCNVINVNHLHRNTSWSAGLITYFPPPRTREVQSWVVHPLIHYSCEGVIYEDITYLGYITYRDCMMTIVFGNSYVALDIRQVDL